jgi:hypothetical protein
MIEIAIALGVIGFALVAIIGILPSGLQVQRDNRSETIINQDGTFWMEAIRNGPRGLDDLTNYVEEITTPEKTFVFGGNGLGAGQFTYGSDIISLLTSAVTNANPDTQVEAIVTAFSGSAAEKEYDQSAREMSFKYRLTVSITNAANTAVPFSSLAPPVLATVPLESLYSLYEVRLLLEYPYISARATSDPNYKPPRHQTYRALASRKLFTEVVGGVKYFFFEP